MKDIIIIGGGPGDADYILPAARRVAEQCDLIIGDGRLLRTFGLKADETHIFEMGPMTKRLEWLKGQPDSLKAGILVSGDPLMYSMFPAGAADVSGSRSQDHSGNRFCAGIRRTAWRVHGRGKDHQCPWTEHDRRISGGGGLPIPKAFYSLR